MALDLPDVARGALARWLGSVVAGREDVRPVTPEALHVTLCFLGWLPEREVGRIAELIAKACRGLSAPVLAPEAVVAVPPRRPRLFALDLVDADQAARAVQSVLSGTLAAARLYEPERRPFWPHVTLARVKRGVRAAPLEAPTPPVDAFEAREVTLYRSTLRPQGALYEPLAGTRLDPG